MFLYLNIHFLRLEFELRHSTCPKELQKYLCRSLYSKREESIRLARFFPRARPSWYRPISRPRAARQTNFLTFFSILSFFKESTNAQVGRFYELRTWISRRLQWTGYVHRTKDKREESCESKKSNVSLLFVLGNAENQADAGRKVFWSAVLRILVQSWGRVCAVLFGQEPGQRGRKSDV